MRSLRALALLAVIALVFVASASASWTPLHVGSSGKHVRDAQYLLKGHNHFRLHTFDRRISGYYGKPTAHATRQAKYWLGYPGKALNGRFGASIYDYLRGHRLPQSFRKRRWTRLTLHVGSHGNRVKDAQWLMKEHNHYRLRTYSGNINGFYTYRTSKSTWWTKYYLGYPKPIFGDFGPKLRNILRGRTALPAAYKHRRLIRAHNPVTHSLSGFAAYARTTVGTAYRWGGTNPFIGGADCSGLVQYLYSRYWHKYIPRTTGPQYYGGRYVPRPTQIGDLIFYHGVPPGHVTMYMGGGKMIEDPHTGAVVYISYVRSGYVGVRRYLPSFLPGSPQAQSTESGTPWWLIASGVGASIALGGGAFLRRTFRKAKHEIEIVFEPEEEEEK